MYCMSQGWALHISLDAVALVYVQHQCSVPKQEVVFPLCSREESKSLEVEVVNRQRTHFKFMQKTCISLPFY